jgi:prepilin-type N-terminal cleavage/methylation domain-containing protein
LTTKSGFTLIELIIVMAMIGGLGAIFMTTFPGAQKKSRDAVRKSDIKQFQTALETYANKNNGVYPSSGGSAVQADTTLCATYLGLTSGSCAKDLKDGQTVCSGLTCRYYYITPNCGAAGTACATSYVLWASLENPAAVTSKTFVACSTGKTAEGTAPTGSNCPI